MRCMLGLQGAQFVLTRHLRFPTGDLLGLSHGIFQGTDGGAGDQPGAEQAESDSDQVLLKRFAQLGDRVATGRHICQ